MGHDLHWYAFDIRHHFKRFILLLLLAVSFTYLSPLALADGDDFSNDLQQWSTVTVRGNITDKAYVQIGFEPRLQNNIREMNETLFYPGIGYTINKHLDVSVHYAGLMDFTPGNGENLNYENRVMEDVTLSANVKKIRLNIRNRLEHRMIGGTSGTSVRLRSRLRAEYPIGKGNDGEETPWFIVGQHEFFTNLNSLKSGPKSGLRQNRSYVGIGRSLGNQARFDAGYQLTALDGVKPDRNNLLHTLMLNVSINAF